MNNAEMQKKISERFSSLISEAENVFQIMKREDQWSRSTEGDVVVIGELVLCESQFYQLQTNVLTLIQFLPHKSPHLDLIDEAIRKLPSKISGIEKLIGILKGLQSDFECGFLMEYSNFVVAEVEANYLQQAEQLLEPKGDYSHVPAAVLLGAILEDALRRICQRQTPEIPVLKSDGDNKMMNALIDDLKKAGIFNEQKAKQLRAWADIRNSAAHGKFEEFTRSDVEQMLNGVRNFLADYLG